MRSKGVLLLCVFTVCCANIIGVASAGEVVVRKSSEAFDAFAVREQVLKDHQWQEILRLQQQIEILQALPSGCLPVYGTYSYFRCDGGEYRPYLFQGKQGEKREVYIRVSP